VQTTEIIPFSTRTVDGFDDLLRIRPAHELIQIRGLLRLPGNSARPRLPLVVVSIGSLGLSSGREDLYCDALAETGIATLVVDSLTTRFLSETASNQGTLSFASSTADALFALAHIRRDPRFEASRIALLGYSRGGLATLMSYDRRLQEAVAGHQAGYCAFVALYPPCFIQWEHPKPPSAPLLMLLGERDDIVPVAAAKAYAERLSASDGNVRVITLENAGHSFDAAHAAAYSSATNLSRARILVSDDGSMRETTTGLVATAGWSAFLGDVEKACGYEGMHTGHGPRPKDIAVRPLVDFLKDSLALGG
jgi:dienelactone hydrolase